MSCRLVPGTSLVLQEPPVATAKEIAPRNQRDDSTPSNPPTQTTCSLHDISLGRQNSPVAAAPLRAGRQDVADRSDAEDDVEADEDLRRTPQALRLSTRAHKEQQAARGSWYDNFECRVTPGVTLCMGRLSLHTGAPRYCLPCRDLLSATRCASGSVGCKIHQRQ